MFQKIVTLVVLLCVAGAKLYDYRCFELGTQLGAPPSRSLGPEVQTDFNRLRTSESILDADSKVRTIKACYSSDASDPTKFTLQMEVWSRQSDRSMWLGIYGDIDIIQRAQSSDVVCMEMKPKKDYVVTEVFMASQQTKGITYI